MQNVTGTVFWYKNDLWVSLFFLLFRYLAASGEKYLFSGEVLLLLLCFVSIHRPTSHLVAAQLILLQAYLDYHNGGR